MVDHKYETPAVTPWDFASQKRSRDAFVQVRAVVPGHNYICYDGAMHRHTEEFYWHPIVRVHI